MCPRPLRRPRRVLPPVAPPALRPPQRPRRDHPGHHPQVRCLNRLKAKVEIRIGNGPGLPRPLIRLRSVATTPPATNALSVASITRANCQPTWSRTTPAHRDIAVVGARRPSPRFSLSAAKASTSMPECCLTCAHRDIAKTSGCRPFPWFPSCAAEALPASSLTTGAGPPSAFSSPGAPPIRSLTWLLTRVAMTLPARRPAMIASVTELEASLFAPCAPVDAASPTA